MFLKLVPILASAFIVASPFHASAWTIDADASALFYVSTKKEHVADRHMLPDLSGQIGEDGVLRVEVDMDSIDSGVDVRDSRMRELLFKTAEFPKGVFTAEVDLSEFEDLAAGENIDSFIDGEMTIAGTTAEVGLEVMVTRISDDRVHVASHGPILVEASQFGLIAGIDALREIAKLPSISYSAPVTFSLVFTR